MGMVEKVARAIYMGRNGHGCKPWGSQTDAHKAPYLTDAKNAMGAARDADDEMIVKGDEVVIEFLNDHAFALKATTPAQECWQAMIDAALKE